MLRMPKMGLRNAVVSKENFVPAFFSSLGLYLLVPMHDLAIPLKLVLANSISKRQQGW